MFGDIVDIITSLGIIGIALTIWSVRRSARLQFEQHFIDRYRDVIARVPLDHLRGQTADHRDGPRPDDTERAYFDYFELCEEQFYYRQSGRISNTTWRDWEIGITSNARLPTFQDAWAAFADLRRNNTRGSLFKELEESRAFEIGSATQDPIARWRLQANAARLWPRPRRRSGH